MSVPTPDEQHYSAVFWTSLIAALLVLVRGVLLIAICACTPLPASAPPPKNHWVESKVANAVYVQDRRTGQCFATWMTGGDSSHVITAVDCTPSVLQAVAEDSRP